AYINSMFSFVGTHRYSLFFISLHTVGSALCSFNFYMELKVLHLTIMLVNLNHKDLMMKMILYLEYCCQGDCEVVNQGMQGPVYGAYHARATQIAQTLYETGLLNIGRLLDGKEGIQPYGWLVRLTLLKSCIASIPLYL
ncbi:hypothetical protein ACJX0J_013077, partial [Zea mays]